jgi:hypothetical protein
MTDELYSLQSGFRNVKIHAAGSGGYAGAPGITRDR